MESIEYSDDFKKSKILYKFISFKKDYCLDILKFNKIYFSTKQQLNDPFDLTTFNYFIDIYDQNFKFNIFDSILNETGIFSMTLDPLNPLMWAHYSEAFTGFCLGLNKNKILGYLNRKKNMGVLEVKYLKENPKLKINFQEPTEYCNIFSTKISDWSYEKEVRLFKFNCIEENSKFLSFDLRIVDEVILGFKCNDENKNKIINILLNIREKGANIKLYQLTFDQINFKFLKNEIIF